MVALAHLALALVLTLFLAIQMNSLVFVLRSRRARAAGRRPTDLLWTSIPVILVLALAARSWVAAFDVERPAVASAVTEVRPEPGPAPAADPAMQPGRTP